MGKNNNKGQYNIFLVQFALQSIYMFASNIFSIHIMT